MPNIRKFSSQVVDGYERAPSRSMLYPVGFKKDDFKKPQVGIASTWSMVTPCNMHINKLAEETEIGVNGAGGKAVNFQYNHYFRRHFNGLRRDEIFSCFP